PLAPREGGDVRTGPRTTPTVRRRAGPRSGQLSEATTTENTDRSRKWRRAIPCAFRVFRGFNRLSLRSAEPPGQAPFVWFVDKNAESPRPRGSAQLCPLAGNRALTAQRACRSSGALPARSPVMAEDPRDWEPETRLVRGGLARSEHGEI